MLGFGLRTVLLGWKGLLSGLAGCLLAGGIMFLFYMVRAMGAGDVKLMAADRGAGGTKPSSRGVPGDRPFSAGFSRLLMRCTAAA